MAFKDQKNTLTSTEICNIIRACGKSGLSKLSFGELQLEFDSGAKEEKVAGPIQQILKAEDFEQLSMPLDGDSSQDLEMPDDVLKMHLATSDPVAWERMQLEGDDYAEKA